MNEPTSDKLDFSDLPGLQCLLALSRRVTPEERIQIDRAVGALFVFSAFGNVLQPELQEANDLGRARILQHLMLNVEEIKEVGQGLMGPFLGVLEDKMTDEEIDNILAFMRKHLPLSFGALPLDPNPTLDLDDTLPLSDSNAEVEAEERAEEGGTSTPGLAPLSPSVLTLWHILMNSDRHHLNNIALTFQILAEAHAVEAQEAGEKVSLKAVLARAAPLIPETMTKTVLTLLPAYAQALENMPPEDTGPSAEEE